MEATIVSSWVARSPLHRPSHNARPRGNSGFQTERSSCSIACSRIHRTLDLRFKLVLRVQNLGLGVLDLGFRVDGP